MPCLVQVEHISRFSVSEGLGPGDHGVPPEPIAADIVNGAEANRARCHLCWTFSLVSWQGGTCLNTCTCVHSLAAHTYRSLLHWTFLLVALGAHV
jgi:hypothetical protein